MLKVVSKQGSDNDPEGNMSETPPRLQLINQDRRRYRTEIPNLVDDMDLSLQAYRLYGHIKRVAGDTGEFYEGTRKTAAACNMAHGSITPAKRELVANGLIVVMVPGNPKECRPDRIRVVDIWTSNLAVYQARSQYEQVENTKHEAPNSAVSVPVQNMNTPCSQDEQPVHEEPQTCSPNEHPCSQYEHKKEPIQERTIEERTKTERARERAAALSAEPEESPPAEGGKKPKTPKLTHDEWLQSLRADPVYSHVEIDRELGKMQRWCEVNNHQPTRKRFINWINRIDKPLAAKANNGINRKNYERPGAGASKTVSALASQDYSGFPESRRSS
jgi:hypothetical protein